MLFVSEFAFDAHTECAKRRKLENKPFGIFLFFNCKINIYSLQKFQKMYKPHIGLHQRPGCQRAVLLEVFPLCCPVEFPPSRHLKTTGPCLISQSPAVGSLPGLSWALCRRSHRLHSKRGWDCGPLELRTLFPAHVAEFIFFATTELMEASSSLRPAA